MSYNIERALRAALNGAPLPKSPGTTIRKNFAAPAYHRHQITMRFSVQEAWGGPRFAVEYSEKNTIDRKKVNDDAHADMAKKGYKNVVLLEVTQS